MIDDFKYKNECHSNKLLITNVWYHTLHQFTHPHLSITEDSAYCIFGMSFTYLSLNDSQANKRPKMAGKSKMTVWWCDKYRDESTNTTRKTVRYITYIWKWLQYCTSYSHKLAPPEYVCLMLCFLLWELVTNWNLHFRTRARPDSVTYFCWICEMDYMVRYVQLNTVSVVLKSAPAN